MGDPEREVDSGQVLSDDVSSEKPDIHADVAAPSGSSDRPILATRPDEVETGSVVANARVGAEPDASEEAANDYRRQRRHRVAPQRLGPGFFISFPDAVPV